MEEQFLREHVFPEKEKTMQAIVNQKTKFRSVSRDDLHNHQQRVEKWYHEKNMIKQMENLSQHRENQRYNNYNNSLIK